ncbi:MAG TPA: thymidine phosphorylase [Labilithrix sp.]|jgi:pyrimidine-nucleoside phosphorylase
MFAFIHAWSGQSGSGFVPQFAAAAAEADVVGTATALADGDALTAVVGSALDDGTALATVDALGVALALVAPEDDAGCSVLVHAARRRREKRRGRPCMAVSLYEKPSTLRPMERTLVELLAAKRDGGTLSSDEIKRLIASLSDGKLADYQMAAFLMAVFFRGLDDVETVALTEAMLHSGAVLDLSSVPGTKVDKHSTGGVGDKVSICLAPLVAACGVPVPMVSGRGLGHTGGTLDKLEAIPGFRTDLSVADFARIVKDVGACMIGQTKEIAPADKRIYALRDVTATVESIPLIVASILSKKLAEGIDGLVLDVKVGKGAFMKDPEHARALAKALVRVGTRAGKKVVAVLTRMDAPLGRAVGNATETREALEVLHGGGPADLVECTLVLGAEMLVLGGVAKNVQDARKSLQAAIANGAAVAVMEKMVAAQHGDASVVTDPKKLAHAPKSVTIEAPKDGFVAGVDALAIGLAGVAMGAGRTRADQEVDHLVGIDVEKKPGDAVKKGEPVARLHLRAASAAIEERVAGAFTYADVPPPAAPLVLERITASDA